MLTSLLSSVHIGINSDMAKDKRHGVAWVRATDGGVIQRPFMVDNPNRLVSPSMLTVYSLFRQLTKMGMYPLHLEILLNNKRTIYKFGRIRPIYIQTV